MTSLSAAVASVGRPTEEFRKEHAQIREHLNRLSAMAGKLPELPPGERSDTMNKIVGFLRGDIQPHAEWEEKVLYPAVDKRAGGKSLPFTATMRNEHKIVGRWISQLDAASKSKSTDPKDFARKTDRLLGLITAHFEDEEDVLLPVLDKTMTAEEFDREIMSKSEH